MTRLRAIAKPQQLNGEHEALKQKWNDLRKALE